MTRRRYDQPCSVACALDRIGERWALLIVRELLLGPLRFSELARTVGGAPTDVLTKRLRNLEQDGIIRRRQLTPPASAPAYELTPLGRELEPTLIAFGRWGLNFQSASDAANMTPSWLPNAVRVILQPPGDASLTLQLDTGGQSYRLRIADGWINAERGPAEDPDLTLAGAPGEIIVMLADADQQGEPPDVEVTGDPAALEALRQMVVLPERMQAEIRALRSAPAAGVTTASSQPRAAGPSG